MQYLLKKHFIRKKKIYFTFVDLEKAFNWVSYSVPWWNMMVDYEEVGN